jgi:hypothetical protein
LKHPYTKNKPLLYSRQPGMICRMDENRNALTRRGPDKKNWYVVAQAMGMTDAEIPAGLLRSAGIPVFLFREAVSTVLPVMPGFGGVQVAVPEAYYLEARALLDADFENLDELRPDSGDSN